MLHSSFMAASRGAAWVVGRIPISFFFLRTC